MGYGIGLDLGITSIGWALLNTNENSEPNKIIDLGVRIFDKPENPKNGSSLALPRREARSARRRLRRHRHRLERIKNLLVSESIISRNDLHNLYNSPQKLTDIYELRVQALDRIVTDEELTRILIHLAQRRGYLSNSKAEQSDKKLGKLLTAVKENSELLKNYRTVAEMLCNDSRFISHKRNKSDSYLATFSRSDIINEIKLIFKSQRDLGNPKTTQELEEKYLKIFESQRHYSKGPGEPSPYAGNQIEKMVGNCTFEREEKRAAKASYTFERFNLFTKINTLHVVKDGKKHILTSEERKAIEKRAYEKDSLKYSDIRKLLNLTENDHFKGVPVQSESKTVFVRIDAYYKIRKALDKIEKGYINKLTVEQLDEIGYCLTVYKDDKTISEKLTQKNIPQEVIPHLLHLSFSKFGHLSLKAIKKILPHLEEGLDYDKACSNAGYDFHGEKMTRERLFTEITNPVVKRAVTQTIKVLNAIIRQYGKPDFIRVELQREMAKSFSERMEDLKSMKENEARNEKAKKFIESLGKKATGENIVKYKLYEEQGGICLYSGKQIKVEDIFDKNLYDVDHIIPYSISFDDSYSNKVLVSAKENRQKGNRLPFEYFGSDPNKWHEFTTLVNSKIKNHKKKENLLKKELTQEEKEEFKDRNLNDTKYISKAIAAYIRDNIEFNKSPDRRKYVFTVNGAVTAYMRKRWGLSKVRENGDTHHALDAAVVACITDGMIKRISKYHKIREDYFNTLKRRSEYKWVGDGYVNKNTGEFINRDIYDEQFAEKFPLPWDDFRTELLCRLNQEYDPLTLLLQNKVKGYNSNSNVRPVFVSRMPNRKISGQVHLETIRSAKKIDEGIVISKTPIQNLKLKKDGEIANYYNPKGDIILYNALKSELLKHNGDGKKAFANGFIHPLSNTPVKKVKLQDSITIGTFVHKGKGIANNGYMVRIDIFNVDGKYMFVPIYLKDTVLPNLPNKACVANKPYEFWKEVDDSCFLFSLYKNDLVKIVWKKPFKVKYLAEQGNRPSKYKELLCYYDGADISTASIQIKAHDNSFTARSIGIATTLESFEKYTVDVLGNFHKVKKEKRMGFSLK